MVRILYIFLFVLLILPANVLAQIVSFDAYIDRESVAAGETFQVKLELIGTQPTSAPDLTVLPSELQVLGQQQQANITFVNGVQSQNLSWILDLVPEKEGTFKIPAIEIKTNAGSLYTKPFRIYVKPASQITQTTSDNSVFIDIQLEKADPYIDEPVLYKTVIYHMGELGETELVKPKSENAIIEQIGEPHPTKQILNGVNYKVVEVEYLLTPIKTGEITVEPSVVRGKIAKDGANTPMDNMFAPFGNMGGLIQTKEYIPFTVASKAVKLNVKPAENGVDPWLPLYDLQIDDELGDVSFDQTNNRIIAKAGEPISRRVRLTGLGKAGELLPELDNMFTSEDFKIYADKAETTKEFIPGNGPIASLIKGTRTQTFTFIPQKTGMLTLPELNIKYWNLKDNKIANANLPGKVITASPGEQTAANDNNVQPAQTQTPQPEEPVQAAQPIEPAQPQTLEEKLRNAANSPQAPNFVLLLLSFIICVIMFISFKIVTTAKKNKVEFDVELLNPKKDKSLQGRKVIDDTQVIRKGKSAKGNLVNLSQGKQKNGFGKSIVPEILYAQSHEELQQLLQKFAAKYLNISQNAGTIIIVQAMVKRFGIDKAEAMKCAAELDSVLYAGKQVDLEYLKSSFSKMISESETKINSSSENNDDDDRLISLNP